MNTNFAGIVKRVSPVLKRITYKLNGHFTFFNDEDLYQEAVVHLWQDFNQGKLSDKTDSYILQGCYFHLKNYIRTHRHKAKLISIEELADDEESRVPEETPYLEDRNSSNLFDYLNSKLLAETICNNGLTRKEKGLLCLYKEGLTTREIGQRLGISHVMVVKLTSRIRSKCLKYGDGFGYQE